MDKYNAIVVFARHPTPGRVKTRLAADVGNDGACRFYKHCAEKVIQECLKTDATTYIFFSAPEEEEQVRAWLAPLDTNRTLQYLPQLQSPDLGSRLADAIHRVSENRNLENRSHHHVAVIGTDVPDLESTHINTAFRELQHYNVIFGPAEDGGYYLCALNVEQLLLLENDGENEFLQSFFGNITWSTETVLQQNVANAVQLRLDVAPLDTLHTLRDIDTMLDLSEWSHRDISIKSPAVAAGGLMMVALAVLKQAEDGADKP